MGEHVATLAHRPFAYERNNIVLVGWANQVMTIVHVLVKEET